MAHYPPLPPTATRGRYVVRMPQAGDMLEGSLKAAFGKGGKLPADMEKCLSLLDQYDS